MTLNANLEKIKNLVDHFETNYPNFKRSSYNEAQLRIDFLDPLFSAFGWDVNNSSGKSTHEREVIIEESIQVVGSEFNKKPDYTFRLNGSRKFFVEAKKPSVSIDTDPKSARQVRRYGFSAKLPISVLTNFEHLAIYDCSSPVDNEDKVFYSRVTLYHYKDFVEKFDEISEKIGRQSVISGKFDDYWKEISEKVEKAPVDKIFLGMINTWRLNFAKYFIEINPSIDVDKLNDLIQSYINSIIFLRICEDRELERLNTLHNLSKNEDYAAFITLLKNSDKKYNAGLFNLEYIDEFLNDKNTYIWDVIKQLYYPESPFSFSVLPVEIIGQIYEMFLGEKVAINDEGEPEFIAVNVDRDIVTTPIEIVSAIVNNVIENHLKGKDPLKTLLESTYADIACGSGAFLLELFQNIHDRLVDLYLKNDPSKIEPIGIYGHKLKFEVKKDILLNNIFGIDKDFNAVRATQFGLLIKLLEDEKVIPNQKPILPSLRNNILFGNSLVNSNDLTDKDPQDIIEINPYDFYDQKFDVIVGNPPYLATEHIKQNTHPVEFEIYSSKFSVATRQFDKYYLFLEQAYDLLKDHGWLGYIIPHKFFKVKSASALRKFLINNHFISEFTYFNSHQVFKGKHTYTTLFFAKKNAKDNEPILFKDILDYKSWQLNQLNKPALIYDIETLQAMEKSYGAWGLQYRDFFSSNHNFIQLGKLLGKGSISNGIQTSANAEYIHSIDSEDKNYYYFTYKGNNYKIEKSVTRPYYRTSNESLDNYAYFKPNSFVIYPYENINGRVELIDLKTIRTDFPCLFKFLSVVKPILNNPKRSIQPTPTNSNEWYRYGRHQALESCDVPEKIIVGVMSKGGKYVIDNKHTFISSGGTAGYCFITLAENSPYSIYYIQAVLQSRYSEYIAKLYGEEFAGGYIARGTKLLSNIRIPKINFTENSSKSLHDAIVDIQKQLIDINQNIISSKNNERVLVPLMRQFDKLKDKLNTRLKELYDLTDEQEKSIPKIDELYS